MSRVFKEGTLMDNPPSRSYEEPRLTVLGTVHVLTQGGDKKLGYADGFTFMGDSITNNS